MDAPGADLAATLAEIRRDRCFPHRLQETATAIAEATLGLLFPHFADCERCDPSQLRGELHELQGLMEGFGGSLESTPFGSELIEPFLQRLPELHRALREDAHALADGDPAASGIDEVILCYPGFMATALHRTAHVMYGLGIPLLPRLIAEVAHARTGIDIHPGATVGRRFAIDHGTGVVIGETAHIGTGVRIYQGVTLGALTVDKALAKSKRHPTIQDNVVIYANATILGGETVIGHDSVIGGNAWITESVPPFSIVGRNSEVRPRKPGGFDGVEFVI